MNKQYLYKNFLCISSMMYRFNTMQISYQKGVILCGLLFGISWDKNKKSVDIIKPKKGSSEKGFHKTPMFLKVENRGVMNKVREGYSQSYPQLSS